MSDAERLRDELLRHQYIYVPWAQEKPIYKAGAGLAQLIASHHRARLTIASPTKSTIPDDMARLPYVTDRVGAVPDGGVVLAYLPSEKTMEKISQLASSIVVLVEAPTEDHSGWARLHGAYNVSTGEVIAADLDDAAEKLLAAIVFEGYNGWNDDIAERITLAKLTTLREAGQYDRALVLAYAREHERAGALDALTRILDAFEGKGKLPRRRR